MSTGTQRRGQCLCGAVRISARNASHSVGACHCKMCRRWGGGPLMAIDCGTDVLIEGEENMTLFDSSAWAERAFCKKCGSNLFYRIKEAGQHFVPAGIFGDVEDLIFDHQVFIDEKPAYYSFANNTQDMTGPEIFAKYGPSD
ncbi:MAG: GFA family protein [Inquilinaceae bacterium]